MIGVWKMEWRLTTKRMEWSCPSLLTALTIGFIEKSIRACFCRKWRDIPPNSTIPVVKVQKMSRKSQEVSHAKLQKIFQNDYTSEILFTRIIKMESGKRQNFKF
jgi:hypothetical protein